MSLEKLRRFVFVIAAVAVFLATVLPNIGVSTVMAGPHPGAIIVSGNMTCPHCVAVMISTAGCAQISCVGVAVIAESDLPAGVILLPVYALATAGWPDELSLAPSTPPI